ncbi:hypothetical protein ACP70R_020466 [Stipagrostis hirtigluma subsp. patula]
MRESKDVMFRGTRFMILTSSFNDALERREYVMCAAGDLKLVHYGKNTDEERADRAVSLREARRLAADIDSYREASARRKEEILRGITGGSSDGGGASAA